MSRVLITGAFGNVGRSTVEAHLKRGDTVTLLEADSPRNRRLGARLLRHWKAAGQLNAPGGIEKIIWGDVRDHHRVREAVTGQDAIVHLAAIIPPAADRDPELAHSVNAGGTRTIIDEAVAESWERGCPLPRLVFASSISIYGDRVVDFWIGSADRLEPSPGDEYGKSKVEAEALVRACPLPWSILRLSYIVWRKKLDPDPLLFHMPLATKIEVCHTEDTGRAFAAAVHAENAIGMTFDIGGGESCRTTYRDYLDRMLRLFGLGGAGWLPEEAFAGAGFHCGWYADSDLAQAVLGFRRKTLEDYYSEVRSESRWMRIGAALARPAVRAALLAGSPFMPKGKRGRLLASPAR